MSEADYIWNHLLYTTGDGPIYNLVLVLAWHDNKTATVLPLALDGAQLIGAEPYIAKIEDLRFGRPPEGARISTTTAYSA